MSNPITYRCVRWMGRSRCQSVSVLKYNFNSKIVYIVLEYNRLTNLCGICLNIKSHIYRWTKAIHFLIKVLCLFRICNLCIIFLQSKGTRWDDWYYFHVLSCQYWGVGAKVGPPDVCSRVKKSNKEFTAYAVLFCFFKMV